MTTHGEQMPSPKTLIAALGPILDPLPSIHEITEEHARAKESLPKGTAPPNQEEGSASVSKKRTQPESECHVEANESAGEEAPAKQPVPKPLAKRPRLKEDLRISSIRTEVAKAARNLRKDGITPISLFFPSLPNALKKDVQLRTAIGPGLQDLKTIQAKGKKMAWATFSSEGECLDKLLTLRLELPNLTVSLHRPKQRQEGVNQNLQVHEKNGQLFDGRVAGVLSRGGLGNTLMFRNLPVEVETAEFENVLKYVLRKVSVSYSALRIRTALSKGRAGRNFWVVYPSIDACKVAFCHLLLETVSFRCGKTTKLHPIIHDDSTDADESKRRGRASALGSQNSRHGATSIYGLKKENNLDMLEHFLRSTQKSFVFLPICPDAVL